VLGITARVDARNVSSLVSPDVPSHLARGEQYLVSVTFGGYAK